MIILKIPLKLSFASLNEKAFIIDSLEKGTVELCKIGFLDTISVEGCSFTATEDPNNCLTDSFLSFNEVDQIFAEN
jgi:hypothetical protein